MPSSGSGSFVAVLAVSVSSLKPSSFARCFENAIIAISPIQAGSVYRESACSRLRPLVRNGVCRVSLDRSAGAGDLVNSGSDMPHALAVSLLVDGPTCTSVMSFVRWTRAGAAGVGELVLSGRVEPRALGLLLLVAR